jgi:hypothetical protein
MRRFFVFAAVEPHVSMPEWPARGSVASVDDAVSRGSELRDVKHAQPKGAVARLPPDWWLPRPQ